MDVLVLTTQFFFLLCCAFGLRVLIIRWRSVARRKKRESLRSEVIRSLAEILSGQPPNALPSSPEYRDYLSRISGSINTLAQSGALARATVRGVLLDFIRNVAGESRARLEQLYINCGFADEAIARLASPAWDARAYAARELGTAHISFALNILSDHLADDNSGVALEALHAVLNIGGVKIIPRIINLLPRITQIEELYLVDICIESGFECIEHITPLLHESRNDVKRFAIDALGALHSFQHVPVIIPFLDAEDNTLAVATMQALGNIGSEDAIDAIAKACERRDPVLQAEAAVALQKIGGARSVDMLTAMLGDPDSRVRGAASGALAKLHMQQVFASSSPPEALAYFKTRSFQSRGAH